MGWNFRRSINLGFFRLNFSQRGIGWSFAPIPGILRWTRTSSGTRYWTFTIPGTGIHRRSKARGKAKN
jgi:hypothetical protein